MELFLLLAVALPFVLPIVSLVRQGRLRARLTVVEELVHGQQRTIEELAKRLHDVRRDAAPAAPPPPVPAAKPVATPARCR